MDGRKKLTDKRVSTQMEVSAYSLTHRWFPVLAVVWWQPNRRQICWAQLPLNKAFSVDIAVSIWLIYLINSIMFKFCHALKRCHSCTWNKCQRMWDSIFSYISNVSSWRSLCNSSDFVTLKIPLAFGYSATMSVIACHSMWGLSDGSEHPPPIPTGDFLWPPHVLYTRLTLHWMQQVEIHDCEGVCVCVH